MHYGRVVWVRNTLAVIVGTEGYDVYVNFGAWSRGIGVVRKRDCRVTNTYYGATPYEVN